MKTLLVGDVHGCSRPLDALIRAARPDKLFLLGDIFAKGPDPRGVWDIIKDNDTTAIMGNHDERLLQVWGQPGSSAHHRCWPRLQDETREWISALPLSRSGDGWTAVHAGVHPTLGLAGTSKRQLLTMRRWPDDEDPENPYWWQLYTLPERIYYGHDAMRGLQVHEATVGLDTGCVYGGELSGMILETGEVFQVEGNVR